jgi:hypothetical protein
MDKLSNEFYSTLESLMLLLDSSYNPIHSQEFSEQMVSRELGKLHYLYIRDTESEV